MAFSAVRVTNGTTVSECDRAALAAIHDAAFPPEERYWPFEKIFEWVGQEGVELWILRRWGEAAGYITLQEVPTDRLVYLWYLAAAPDRRNAGLGAFGIRTVLADLAARAKPPVAVFFDARAPEGEDTAAPKNVFRRRRLSWYRQLGAYWLKGLDYPAVAANDAGEEYPCYILFFRIAGMPDEALVRLGAIAIAAYFFAPDDPRRQRLVKSFETMEVIPPTGV